MHIAMLGTRGVPARYGGFETCVEEVGARLVARGHEVTVYCRDTGAGSRPTEYRGMRLVFLPAVRHRALETLSHTGASVAQAVSRRRPDVALLFNGANAPWLPFLRMRGIPVVTHVDGLEWKRSKWGPMAQRYYKATEPLCVWWSDAIIADSQGIADHYRESYDADSELIAYGAPLVDRNPGALHSLRLEPDGYHLVVARFEPENHVREIVEGYVASDATKPLVVVGDAPYGADYIRQVHSAADDRVRMLGSVWDQDLLDQLYANCFVYWHGHSVGGTNPSLLRAIGASAPTNAFDVRFNREVLARAGSYWTTPADVRGQVEASEADPLAVAARGRQSRVEAARYDWDDVSLAYEELCARIARVPGRVPSSVAHEALA